jgi:hypothetical protein
MVSWWFINGLSYFFKYKKDKAERIEKGVASKNITFMNVTYDLEFFKTHDYLAENPLAA